MLNRRTILFGLVIVSLAVSLLCWQGDEPGSSSWLQAQDGEKTPKLPPLVIDRSAPLLLDEPAKKDGEDKQFLNINQSCFVCHDNYRTEPMAVWHAKESVGCIDCHGPSLAHRNDEDNITPPDKMYPLAEIDKSCADCHDTHDAPAKEVIARWQERCPGKTDLSEIACTDCHGYHRLEKRVVRWNKMTGELLLNTPAKTQ
jgi:hypothetical protein